MVFIVQEEDYTEVIATVTCEPTEITKMAELVALAVKEEWSYDKVELVNIDTSNSSYYDYIFNFDCITEDDDEEIRAVKVKRITQYS